MREAKDGNVRYIYMDVIRIIGCVLVICLHMATADINDFSITGIEWKVMNAMDSIGMTGIAFFYMISGALFLRKESNISLKYVWKKIFVLMVVYVGILFFYNIIPFIRGWVPWELDYIKKNLIGSILQGTGNYHLGFLPTLMVLYALSPVLKDAFASKKNCEYFLVLFAIFGTLIPFLLRFDFRYDIYLESFQERFGSFWLTGHIGYFVLGHYLHEFVGKLSRKKMVLAVLVATGTMLLTIFLNHRDAVAKNGFSIIANTPLSITGFLFAISVYLFVKTAMAECQMSKGLRIVQYIASLTFGIYLIHPFVMNTFVLNQPWREVIGNYGLLVVSRILFIIVVAGTITAILKLIPFVKKII